MNGCNAIGCVWNSMVLLLFLNTLIHIGKINFASNDQILVQYIVNNMTRKKTIFSLKSTIHVFFKNIYNIKSHISFLNLFRINVIFFKDKNTKTQLL